MLTVVALQLTLAFNHVVMQRRGVVIPRPLYAKAAKAAGNEVRVRLLKDSTEGLGQRGDIVMISTALWINVYQPKKLAVKIRLQRP